MSVTLALTWGGVRFAWTSVHVLAPLCFGVVTIAFFFVVEAYWVKDPTVSIEPLLYISYTKKLTPSPTIKVPPFIVSNRTTLSG